ncbi:metallophosphoesterase family protein [Rubrivirga sp. IMCC45206]|uniref:metallophosphoesterase family protein n=1 Tax=Rubrivirga sp. IMCC45206 TaxID=3391614 RepID=UPI00398FD020
MSRPRARLLVSGDLHLGRYPSRVPPGDPALGVEAVVRALVDQAVERRVDAVVLTGDVADESNKFFEAFGVLERTLHRLADAGVPVFAVAGNHDHDVLGAVADAVGKGVRVLGRGQTWETADLEVDGRVALRFCGWSFAGAHASALPLDGFPPAGDVPLVGIAHTQIDDAASPYAPVALADLWATGASAWLLGHVHGPRVETLGGRLVLYPGSPQPLDPGEPGAHGAYLVEIAEDGTATAELLPLATVRYDGLTVDVGGAERPADLRERVAAVLRHHAEAVRDEAPEVRRAVVRLTLAGRTAAYRSVEAVAAELLDAGETAASGLVVAVDRVVDRARPALDLVRLAAGSGPVATLAGLARRLESGTPSESDLGLIRQSVEALQQARRARVFDPLARDGRLDGPLETEAVARLQRQTYRLLDEALAQRPHDAIDVPAADASGDGVASGAPPAAPSS